MVMVSAAQPTLTPLVDDGLPPLFLLRPDREVPQHDEGVQGEVRAYAGGQRSSVTRLDSDTHDIAQTVVTDAAGLERLRALRGREVCYRDGLGVKVWGVYFRHPWMPSEDGALRIVTLSFSSLTVDESA